MRRIGITALSLALLLAGSALAGAAEKSDADKPAASCSRHNTQVDFFDTPSEAATQAKKDGKLVFVLHISGYFEDPKFT